MKDRRSGPRPQRLHVLVAAVRPAQGRPRQLQDLVLVPDRHAGQERRAGDYPTATRVGVGYLASPAVRERCYAPEMAWHKRFREWNRDKKLDAWDDKTWDLASRELGRCPRISRNWRYANEAVRSVNKALLAALAEMLRPVRVRDVSINILGRVEDARCEAPYFGDQR